MKEIEKEIWKDVFGYEMYYKISSFGRIKCKPRKKRLWHNGIYILPSKILRPSIRMGYFIIVLSKDLKRKTHSINRLVAQAFIENPNNHPEVNHIDGNKLNNRLENLEWATKSFNVKHSYEILKRSPSNKGAKLIKSVVQISSDGFVLGDYKSIKEASEQTGVNRHHIGKCVLQKRRLAGGFIWI